MSQVSHYAAEILAQHNNDLFKEHCRALMRTTNENKALACLALAVFGEAPAVNENGYMGSSQDAEEGGLTGHARRELGAAGLLSPDSDYDGMLGESVLDLVRVFSLQGHSGGSAGIVLEVFDRVARWQPLSDITNDPREWMKHSDEVHGEPGGLWQNRRRSTSFSRDGGETWYDIEDAAKNNGDVWVKYEDVQLGDIEIGEDRVRVKDNAYEGVYAQQHNGKEGLVVGVRNGMVTVKYDSDSADVMGHQHQPDKLQRHISATT